MDVHKAHCYDVIVRGRPKERHFGLLAEIDEHIATEMVRSFGQNVTVRSKWSHSEDFGLRPKLLKLRRPLSVSAKILSVAL